MGHDLGKVEGLPRRFIGMRVGDRAPSTALAKPGWYERAVSLADGKSGCFMRIQPRTSSLRRILSGSARKVAPPRPRINDHLPNLYLTSPIDTEPDGSTQTYFAGHRQVENRPSTCGNVDSRRRPYKAKVGGSTPSAPTEKGRPSVSPTGSRVTYFDTR